MHPPHFFELLLFLETYRAHYTNADFHVVFSTLNERASFVALPEYVQHQNVTLHVYNSTVEEFGSDPVVALGTDPVIARFTMIVAKKWWCVATLLHRYEYFMMMDSEVRILRDYDLHALSRYIFNLKLLFGARTTEKWAVQNAFMRFNASEEAQLKELTKNGTLYFWFNEIPVVEAASAARFLKLGYLRKHEGIKRDFDFIIYAYYMMLHEGLNLIDLSPLLPPVDASLQPFLSLGEHGGGTRDILLRSQPHWAFATAWKQDACRFDGLDIVMTFHNDCLCSERVRFFPSDRRPCNSTTAPFRT